mgnify:FL=1
MEKITQRSENKMGFVKQEEDILDLHSAIHGENAKTARRRKYHTSRIRNKPDS